MSGEGEFIGDIAAGALAARAVDPSPGKGGDNGHSHKAACLNCGTVLLMLVASTS